METARRAVALTLLVAGSAQAADPDPWLGTDKALHFSASAVIAMSAYGASATFLDTSTARLAYGASASLLAGIGKELWDSSGNGNASWKDLAWDVAGVAVGLAICWVLDRLL